MGASRFALKSAARSVDRPQHNAPGTTQVPAASIEAIRAAREKM